MALRGGSREEVGLLWWDVKGRINAVVARGAW